MAKVISIPLVEPLTGHGGKVTEIYLREPRGVDLIEIGEPYSYARADKGLIVHAEDDVAIKAYLERCIVSGPNGGPSADALLAMQQLSLADMLEVKAQLLNFFMVARQARAPLSSSSPISDGSTPPGAAISR